MTRRPIVIQFSGANIDEINGAINQHLVKKGISNAVEKGIMTIFLNYCSPTLTLENIQMNNVEERLICKFQFQTSGKMMISRKYHPGGKYLHIVPFLINNKLFHQLYYFDCIGDLSGDLLEELFTTQKNT